jgi:hypothetical protein
MMEYHEFGEPPDQHSTDVGLVLTGPESVSRLLTGINARIESSQLGVGLTGPDLDLRALWLVVRELLTPTRGSRDRRRRFLKATTGGVRL